jgi:hypothetical protein
LTQRGPSARVDGSGAGPYGATTGPRTVSPTADGAGPEEA